MGRSLKALLFRFRIGFFLLAALLVPFLAGPGGDAEPVLLGWLLGLVPTAAAPLPAPGDEAAWRETSYRLLLENADLRSRLLALGEPAGLKARDTAWWDANPVRFEAKVIARDASPFRGSLLVGAGSRDGVRPGFPVVIGEALLGTVAAVGTHSSSVRLVSDPGHRIWAMVLSGGVESQGYTEGTGERHLTMHLVPTKAAAVESPVFTAGEDGVLPRGLLLGRIRKVEDLDRDGIAEVELVPEVDAATVGFVNILLSE